MSELEKFTKQNTNKCIFKPWIMWTRWMDYPVHLSAIIIILIIVIQKWKKMGLFTVNSKIDILVNIAIISLLAKVYSKTYIFFASLKISKCK